MHFVTRNTPACLEKENLQETEDCNTVEQPTPVVPASQVYAKDSPMTKAVRDEEVKELEQQTSKTESAPDELSTQPSAAALFGFNPTAFSWDDI